MKKELKVSIVVLAYNVGRFLKKCLDSAIEQTYQNIEIVVVINGNSADDTEVIARQYADNDSQIILVKNNRNSIISEGWKLGFKTMTGDYFTLLDGDDYLYKDAVENLVNAIDSDDIEIVAGQITRIDENDAIIGYNDRPDFEKLNAIDLLKLAYPYMDYLTHGKLFKSSLFNQDINYPPSSMGHDMLLTYQLVLNARTIKNLTKQVHFFRKNTQSISNNMTINRLKDAFICHLTMRNILIDRDLYKDEEIKILADTDILRILVSCLISGKKAFYKEYEKEIKKIFNGGSLDNTLTRNYLNGWKGILLVLDTYRKYPALANLLMPVVDWLRKKLKK